MTRTTPLIILVGALLLVQGLEIIGGTNGYHAALFDDGYYYLQIGRNIARGLGPTFDGEHFTNGYHPLWMGFAILAYRFFPDSPIFPILVLQMAGAILFAGTAVVLWKIIKALTSRIWLPTLLLGFYIFNPWNVEMATDGLETSLVVFLFALFFLLFTQTITSPRPSTYLRLSVVAGLMTLARADYGLFAAGAFLYLAITAEQRRVRALFLLGAPFAAIVLPWIAYSVMTFGTPVQESGLAYTIINHSLFLQKTRTPFEIVLWSGYEFLKNALRVLTYAGIPLPRINLQPVTVFAETLLVALIAFFAVIRRITTKHREALLSTIRNEPVGRALLIILPLFLVFLFIHGAIRWSGRPWYFMSAPFLAAITFAVCGEKIFSCSALAKKRVALFVGSAAAILAFQWQFYGRELGLGLWRTTVEEPPTQYLAARWMNENLPARARIASFNSGEIGYYTNRFVMNSDGLVNHDVYRVMAEKRRLWDFFKKEGIEYLIDTEVTIRERYRWLLGIENPLAHLVLVQSFTASHQERPLNLYRVISYDEP